MGRKLERKFVEKVWGVDRLPSPFPHPTAERIGEVWFEPPGEVDQLLLKRLFTSERLSVQVHPSDAQAQLAGQGKNGKEECWIISDAEPGAVIALGFDSPLSEEDMRAAALDGSIMNLLSWHDVSAGDVFHIPPGTVHAIGGGISLLEVQPISDITYRLFDYGRPRELHVDEAMGVAQCAPYPMQLKSRVEGDYALLVDGQYFRVHSWQVDAGTPPPLRFGGPCLLTTFSGSCMIDGQLLSVDGCLVTEFDPTAISGEDACLIIVEPA